MCNLYSLTKGQADDFISSKRIEAPSEAAESI
jgi:hypothetical protein